jgi:acetyl-CoA C-acetyltransferase
VIVSAVRTGVGKYGGQYVNVSEDKLCAVTMKEAVARARIDPSEIEDAFVGNLRGRYGNVGRVSYLVAGLPVTTPVATVDRQCGASLQAIECAATKIISGFADVILASGTENMTLSPYQMAKVPNYQWEAPKFLESRLDPDEHVMIETAENVAKKYGASRQECDQWAVISHLRASGAIQAGLFDREKAAVLSRVKGKDVEITQDECVRSDTHFDKLSKMSAVMKPDGVVTAGNACPRGDGAASALLMSDQRAKDLGLTPMAKIRASAVVGLDPLYMGYGPVPAIQKALKQSGLTIADIDCFEINEAFAAQFVPCVRDLGIDPEKVNPNGGAIAMGHPLGATGAILTTKLLYAMERGNLRLGVVAMCVGGGQGMAVVYERD